MFGNIYKLVIPALYAMGNPNHVGIILDGNRRFAKRLMVKPWEGHKLGAEKVTKLLEWCKELDIRELTLFIFSTENFNRPKEEFDYIMGVFREGFDKLRDDKKIEEYGINVRFIGRIRMLPEGIQQKIRQIEERTRDFSNYRINFAIAYGGRFEIAEWKVNGHK